MKLLMRFHLCLVLCCLAFSAQATQMIPLPVEDLTRRADLVLKGHVLTTACLKDREGRIYTRIEFKVDEVWKGSMNTNQFVIVQGGGTLGNERLQVVGEASYEPGEELVSFLRLNPMGEGVSIGLAQGKFNLWKDETTGEVYAHNLFHGKTKAQAAIQPAISSNSISTRSPLKLTELHDRVKGGLQ